MNAEVRGPITALMPSPLRDCGVSQQHSASCASIFITPEEHNNWQEECGRAQSSRTRASASGSGTKQDPPASDFIDRAAVDPSNLGQQYFGRVPVMIPQSRHTMRPSYTVSRRTFFESRSPIVHV